MENAQTVESVIENILKENALMGKLSNRKSPSRKCSNGKSPNRKLLNTNLMKNGPKLEIRLWWVLTIHYKGKTIKNIVQ